MWSIFFELVLPIKHEVRGVTVLSLFMFTGTTYGANFLKVTFSFACSALSKVFVFTQKHVYSQFSCILKVR
jgi:hypothetical protein